MEDNCVGAIVCKLDMHKKMFRRGYIAMLAVDSKFRRKGIGMCVSCVVKCSLVIKKICVSLSNVNLLFVAHSCKRRLDYVQFCCGALVN